LKNKCCSSVIIIQNGEPRAVLQDLQGYEAMRNAVGILKLVSQGEADIRNGKTLSQDAVFGRLEEMLA
jgi:PHD/YefM family antitoxin component YafN of YafNO toxin-antitoxin module